MPWSTYWAHDSMSRDGTRVSSPAQRPTIVSTPSAPITIRARYSSSWPRSLTRTCQRPSPFRAIAPASAPTRTSAPARADSAFGDDNLGVIGRLEDHASDPARGPVGAVGIGEFPKTRVADAFGATDG